MCLQWQANSQASIKITIDGSIDLDIPPSVWLPQMQQVKGCLMKSCPNDHIVLGDWIFQSALVMFDLGPTSFDKPPHLGFAGRKTSYEVGKKYNLHEGPRGVTKVAMTREKISKQYKTPSMPGYGGKQASVSDVSLSIVHDLYYLLPVMVGQPPQRFDVVFGSRPPLDPLPSPPSSHLPPHSLDPKPSTRLQTRAPPSLAS